jgi:hypothetical protein
MYVSPDENFSHIYFNFSQIFWVAAALQHLQTSHPDAYVQRLLLQEITQMNKKTF